MSPIVKRKGKRIEALVDVYQAIDKIAARDTRWALDNPLVDRTELELYMSPKRYDECDPRLASTYCYANLAIRLIDQALVKKGAGDLDGASTIRAGAYRIQGLHEALSEIRELAVNPPESKLKKIVRQLKQELGRAVQNMYYPAP